MLGSKVKGKIALHGESIYDLDSKIFTNPKDKRSEDYSSGHFE
ncbi:hypothetical protein DSOL_0524 [Desulfosporosinus metallidurans]|uniref:Uncharacterized protein n=1 Tax=Desulfosporosinus metallidurans TaxID=1888891 RepID=A0A1Q8R2K1_9FIRM|nr:hypothetical protein DSOL_0524 [Desulfosporosinus metallidurans]